MFNPGLPIIERKDIDIYTFRLCDTLGEGAFGIVYKGNVKESFSDEVAIKMLPLTIREEHFEDWQKLLDREVNLMQDLSHDHILSLIDVILSKRYLYLITELCNEGDLEARKKDITVGEALLVVKEIAEAMAYANKKKIMHRDIKPANILIHHGHVKVADFGLARAVESTDKLHYSEERGSPLYMAPEVYFGKKYGLKCDVWSLGVLLYELLFKRPPWYGYSARDLFENIESQTLNLKPEKGTDLAKEWGDDIKDLLRFMLKKTEESRFDFEQVLEHEVFKRNLPKKLTKKKK